MKRELFLAAGIAGIVLCIAMNVDAKVVTSGLISRWRFDEGGGATAYDESNYATFDNGNNGVIHGATAVSGKFGNALQFDGLNDYIDCGDTSFDIGTNDFSIDAWIKTTSASQGCIVGKRPSGALGTVNGYYLYLTNTGALYFRMENSNGSYCIVSGGNIKSNQGWHHVAITVDRDNASGLKLYIDGIQCGSSINPTGVAGSLSNSVTLAIGEITAGGSYPFSGVIDDVKIYNRSLSVNEISQNFNLPDFYVSSYGGSLGNTVAAAISGGGRVLIDEDVTACNVDLTGANGLIIEGAGGVIYRGGTGNDPIFLAQCCTDVEFQGVHFEGTFDTETGAHFGQCIRTDNTGLSGATIGLQIRNCIFTNTSGDAIRLGPATYNTIVKNCSMYGCLGFVEMSGLGPQQQPVDGVKIMFNDVISVLATTTTYRPGGISGSDDIIDGWGNVKNVDIAHNTIDGNSNSSVTTICNHGVWVHANSYTGTGGLANWHIYDNTFKNFTNDGHYGDGISGAIGFSCLYGGTYPDAMSNLVVENNQIQDCRKGFFMEGADSAGVFRNNTVTHATSYAVKISYCNDFLIKNNSLSTTNGDSCVYMLGNNNSVTDNSLNVGNRYGVLISIGNAQEVSHNTITKDEYAGIGSSYIRDCGTGTILLDNTCN